MRKKLSLSDDSSENNHNFSPHMVYVLSHHGFFKDAKKNKKNVWAGKDYSVNVCHKVPIQYWSPQYIC